MSTAPTSPRSPRFLAGRNRLSTMRANSTGGLQRTLSMMLKRVTGATDRKEEGDEQQQQQQQSNKVIPTKTIDDNNSDSDYSAEDEEAVVDDEPKLTIKKSAADLYAAISLQNPYDNPPGSEDGDSQKRASADASSGNTVVMPGGEGQQQQGQKPELSSSQDSETSVVVRGEISDALRALKAKYNTQQ